MSIKTCLRDIFFKIDSSERTNTVIMILQIIATLSAFSYSYFKDTQIEWIGIFPFIFAFCQFTVLAYLIIVGIVSGKYRPIKLRLNRTTGMLYDNTTNFRNIALRDETLNLILDKFSKEDAYDLGKEVGKNFCINFVKELHRKGTELSIDDKLKKWIEYDSSSGIGKFQIIEHSNSPIHIKIKISSPFIGDCPISKEPNSRCKFLLGYVEGLISQLYSTELTLGSGCSYNSSPSHCTLTLSPK
ncbi:hypothetical protein [Methanolobus sp. WCC4]|uniref:hypothetical protein n=1 Tax=Methanolobus sp. WCC4 TaxID=3125784 RepID=UPI0030F66CD1